jgi:hypothetical protein
MTIEVAPKYFPVIRQNGNLSKQPRFKEVRPRDFFTSLFRFVGTDIQDEPKYGNRERDAWLRRVWKLEPYLSGVINSVVSIDKNRGWTITGGRNQVRRFVSLLHERFFFAPDLSGWRMSFGGSALSYYTADLGSVTELGRQGKDGPLDSLYFVDPARCNLTGNFDTPLKYNPNSRGNNYQPWGRNDYFRVVSMPDTDESLFGLGYCAVSRCIELAKIMIGIYQYDNEMLLNRAPRGLLLLKGITQDQWDEAMTTRVAKLDGDEKRYYGAVHVLATLDPGVEIEAQLTALSQLPAEFDQRTFTDLLMYGYSLAFGYDPREFWPVSSGALGTATETEAQHRKAGGKGGLDFTLGFAEKLNDELPNTVQFEFEERDLDGELANATVEQAKADVIMTMYDKGAGIISQEEARILAAERQLINQDWTLNVEDVTATDTDDAEISRALSDERAQRAIWKYPDEPIVRYKFSVVNGKEKHEYRTLLKPNRSSRRSYVVARSFVRRQIEDELADYQHQLDELARQASEGEIDQDEFEDALEATTVAILVLAVLRGTEGTNEAEQLLIDAALMVLGGEGYDIGLETLTDPAILEEALPSEAVSQLQTEIELSLASTLAADIFGGEYAGNAEGLLSRLVMWGVTALGLYHFGLMVGHPGTRYQWNFGGTIEHCGDCARLNGQVHTGQEWARSGWRPQGRSLECGGHHCLCGLSETSLPVSGSF